MANKEKTYSELIIAWAAILTLIVLCYQQYKTIEFKKYDNYNEFNKIYREWYDDMPAIIKNSCGRQNIDWDELNNDDKAWIRKYFDLYSQEYYFYKNGTIPKEMWENLIHGTEGLCRAAMVNLREFPILLEGYKHWKKMGAFKHPDDFEFVLDKKIKECKKMLNEKPVRCN